MFNNKTRVGSSSLFDSRDGDTKISTLNNKGGVASQVICGRKNEQTNPAFLPVDKPSAKGKFGFNFSLPENWEASLANTLASNLQLDRTKAIEKNCMDSQVMLKENGGRPVQWSASEKSKLHYNYDTKSNENYCTKCKEFIDRELTLKKWEENLKEREQRIQDLEAKKVTEMKDFEKLSKRLATLEEKFEENMKYSYAGLPEKEKVNYTGNEKRCDIIQLNVGGWKFATTLSSLRAEKGSVLGKMFSDGFTINRDNDGFVFIDRSGEHFNFILDYLRGNIVGIDDILFDENTRKKLIKEAEYYQLEGMKNILAFKSSSVEKENDCDCKPEVIEIVENVIQNKEAIRNVLDESKSVERNIPREDNLSSIEDLNLEAYLEQHNEIFYQTTRYRTISPMTFENKIWDGVDFKGAIFEHSITFKQCSFVNANFNCCKFSENTIVSFHCCDLINTSFAHAAFRGKIHFDGSDLRFAQFSKIIGQNELINKIQSGAVTFDRVKYVSSAEFGNKAINVVIKLMNKIN